MLASQYRCCEECPDALVCYFFFFNLVVSTSLMTFGEEGHRVQARSARRTEVRCPLVICFSGSLFWKTNFFSMYFCVSDLDSAVSSGGLDQILSPPGGQIPNQPSTRSFFQSVTVTKVVKPDGVRGAVFCQSPNGRHLLQFFNGEK